MTTALLQLAHDADVAGFLRTSQSRSGLTVCRDGDGSYRVAKAAGDRETLLVRLTPGRSGWVARIDVEAHPDLVPALARTLPVRVLRMLIVGDVARPAAIYSWWGPGCEAEQRPLERQDPHLGLRVEAAFTEAAVDAEAGKSEWGGSTDEESVATLPCLEADIRPVRGGIMSADLLTRFLAQLRRAVGYGTDENDPVRAILEGEIVQDPPGDGRA